MNEHISLLANKYRDRGLLLDTVLFVLLLYGSYDRKLIGVDKRLKQYAPEDLQTLVLFINFFKKLVTTPNILTEVSNLSGHLSKTELPIEFVRRIAVVDEEYCPSIDACKSEIFKVVGLTDSAIAEIAEGKYLVLTDDFRLVGQLEKQKIDVLNFNHVRVLNW